MACHVLGAIRRLLELTQRMVETIQSAAKHMSGHRRRAFQAEVALQYCAGSARRAESVERCGGILENHGNGTLLSSIEHTLAWAASMTWRGVQPIVQLSQPIYETGVSITKRAFASVAARLQRSAELPRGSVTIEPQTAPIAHIP